MIEVFSVQKGGGSGRTWSEHGKAKVNYNAAIGGKGLQSSCTADWAPITMTGSIDRGSTADKQTNKQTALGLTEKGKEVQQSKN